MGVSFRAVQAIAGKDFLDTVMIGIQDWRTFIESSCTTDYEDDFAAVIMGMDSYRGSGHKTAFENAVGPVEEHVGG